MCRDDRTTYDVMWCHVKVTVDMLLLELCSYEKLCKKLLKSYVKKNNKKTEKHEKSFSFPCNHKHI